MNNGWEKKRLGDIVQKISTINPRQTPEEEFDYIDVSSVSNETFEIETTQRLKGKDAPSRARRIVKANDVLFATVRPTLRRIAVVPPHLDSQVCSTGYFVLRPKPGIDHRFVFYSLFTDKVMERMEKIQKGASYPAVNDGQVRAQLIPVPPLPEQQRIVGLLDEAFDCIAAARAHAEQNLANARALFESHLNAVFTEGGEGWVEKRLGDVCQTGAGGTPLKMTRAYYDGGDIPWLMSGEVGQGEVFSATKFITQEGLENSSAKLFPENTVLVAMYGATAGEVGILRFEASTNQAVCGIYPNKDFLPEYLFYVLLSKKRELISQATGNAQPNISQIKIKNTQIPVIPLAEQHRTVETLSSLSAETQRLEALYQQKLDALDELKQSLLHQAFSGQL